MIIQPRYFVRFLDGRASDRINIAFLPGALGGHIRTVQTDFMMRRDYALKLMKRKTNFQEFGEVQNTIDNGHCILDGPRHLAFLQPERRIMVSHIPQNKKEAVYREDSSRPNT
jgi:hypothetical protein